MVFNGRCFRCKKRGHTAIKCPSKRRKIQLSDLPIELLDLISDFLINWTGIIPLVSSMSNLRLTCKTINQKTNDFFAKAAFRHCTIDIGLRSLQRLSGIAQVPDLASKVQWIILTQRDRMFSEYEVYLDAMNGVDSEEHSRRERREIKSHIRRARFEQDDNDFVERSGADTIALAMALQRLPNLRKVTFLLSRADRPSIRRHESGDTSRQSTTHMFSILTAALSHAGVKLQNLTARNGARLKFNEGISLQALSMPNNVLGCFSELRQLTLYLQTKDQSYRNPEKWHTFAARFIANCPQLRKLDLEFRDNWEETAMVFESVANQVQLPSLESLYLSFIQCVGKDLRTFLNNHTNLQSLTLESLHITGDVGFADILGALQETHTELSDFSCYQIAQETRRLYFETLGDLDCDSRPTFRLLPSDDEEQTDFFDDFVNVRGPFHYDGSAHPWDFGGVQRKLGLLRDDLRVSTMSRETDSDPFYVWRRSPI